MYVTQVGDRRANPTSHWIVDYLTRNNIGKQSNEKNCYEKSQIIIPLWTIMIYDMNKPWQGIFASRKFLFEPLFELSLNETRLILAFNELFIKLLRSYEMHIKSVQCSVCHFLNAINIDFYQNDVL